MGIDQNVLSAICIGGIIAAMSIAKNAKLKALIFSLPISITTALIATGGTITSANVIGLLFLCLFLWSVAILYKKGVHILLADIISAGAYLVVGYFAVTYIRLSFVSACALYLLIWLAFMAWHRRRKPKFESSEKSNIHPAVKIGLVSTLAYFLLSLKAYLVGIIVTFPFAAVFAVVESRRTLGTLATAFCQNSIAILAFFIAVYSFNDAHIALKIGVSWAVYLLALWLVALSAKLSFTLPRRTPSVEEDAVS